jgi:hypothetical protein
MVQVFAKTSDVYKAFLVIIAAYYVADLKYPKAYCNILGYLQQFVVGESYTNDKSAYLHSDILE